MHLRWSAEKAEQLRDGSMAAGKLAAANNLRIVRTHTVTHIVAMLLRSLQTAAGGTVAC